MRTRKDRGGLKKVQKRIKIWSKVQNYFSTQEKNASAKTLLVWKGGTSGL